MPEIKLPCQKTHFRSALQSLCLAFHRNVYFSRSFMLEQSAKAPGWAIQAGRNLLNGATYLLHQRKRAAVQILLWLSLLERTLAIA